MRDAERGNAAPRFLSAIFGDDPIPIAASAIAARTITSVYAPPTELINVDPAAADYNEVWAYCLRLRRRRDRRSRGGRR